MIWFLFGHIISGILSAILSKKIKKEVSDPLDYIVCMIFGYLILFVWIVSIFRSSRLGNKESGQ